MKSVPETDQPVSDIWDTTGGLGDGDYSVYIGNIRDFLEIETLDEDGNLNVGEVAATLKRIEDAVIDEMCVKAEEGWRGLEEEIRELKRERAEEKEME